MDAALLVACTSLALAAASLGWQVAAWQMDGRRTRVTLVHGLMNGRSVYTGKVGRDGRPRDLTSLRRQGIDGPELIGVAVTNVGRAPVRVDRYGIELVKGGYSLTPVAEAIGPELPYRLAPGETETWYARVDSASALVAAARAVGRGPSADVRAVVELGTGDEKRTRRTLKVAVPR